MKRRLKQFAALAAAVFMGMCGFALKAGAETWYFTGAQWTPMMSLSNWNSVAGGGGSAPSSFDTEDTWIASSKNVVIGDHLDTFLPTFTVQGTTTVGGYLYDTRWTILEKAVVGKGQTMNIRASANGSVVGIGINDLQLDGTVQFTNHTTSRSIAINLGDLTGSGLLYAGSTGSGVESMGSSLDPQGDLSGFTGVLKFHNTKGWFRGSLDTVDMSSAQLFIEQATASDQTTEFFVEKDIRVKELNIAGTIYSDPASYTASQLNALLSGERITVTDRVGGHTITVIP